MLHEFWARLRVILIAAYFICSLTGLLVFPSEVASAIGKLAEQSDQTRQLMVVAAVVLDLFFLALIYQELRPRAALVEGLLVQNHVGVSLESVQSTLNQQLGKLEGFRSVFTRARNEQGKVALEIEIYGEENLNIPQATKQIEREVVKVVDKQMGLKRRRKAILQFHLGDSLENIPKEKAPVWKDDETIPLLPDDDETKAEV